MAWAGEGGEEPRLGWWRSDLVSEFGGEDLFRRLTPHTWPWTVLQAVREAARRRDAELRSRDHDPDRLVSIFHLGFHIDERTEERLRHWKRSGLEPRTALPELAGFLGQPWDREGFADWVRGHGEADFAPAPAGRCLAGPPPASLDLLVGRLAGALWPLADGYSLPHYRRPH